MDTEKAKSYILLAVLLAIIVATTIQLNSIPSIRFQSDLFTRWYSTQRLLDTGRSLYNFRNMEEAVGFKSLPTSPVEAGFYYPAHLLAFLVPLAYLPFPLANFIWTFLGQLFYVIGLWIIMREINWPSTITMRTVVIFLAIFFIPFIQHTIWSQFDTLAVLGMAMVFKMIRKERFFYAGLWGSLLTFKPQDALLTLAFFLVWSLFSHQRRRFIVGFLIACSGLWAFAQALQPGWVFEFLRALTYYRSLPYELTTITNIIGEYGKIIRVILLFILFILLLYNRNEKPSNTGFYLLIVLSLGIFWMIFPVIGMMHLVLMPIGMLFMLAGLHQYDLGIYKKTLVLFLMMYVLGYTGFFYGWLTPDIEGDHIYWVEMVYKLFTPLLMVVLAIFTLVSHSAGGTRDTW